MSYRLRRLLYGCAVLVAGSAVVEFAAGAWAQTPAVAVEEVRPSVADPAVRQFDDPSVVLTPAASTGETPLVLFLTGTGGHPRPGIPVLQTAVGLGYRVVALTYDDTPAVSQVCPRRPDPACSGRFREMRAFGRGPAPVENPPAEAINARLVALLRYLDHRHPGQEWAMYLRPDGRPAWDRMVVSGLSQGAGMAAWIAKFYPVRRVVLFSSPWDTTGRDRRPAPWLYRPSATPMDRWWAERHRREKTTELIAHAYAALGIPPSHILLFDEGLPEGDSGRGENPFHGSTIRNPAYAPEWRTMFGTP